MQHIVEAEPVVPADVPRQSLRGVHGAARPRAGAPFRRAIQDILEEEPLLLSVVILRWVREMVYDGGKCAM